MRKYILDQISKSYEIKEKIYSNELIIDLIKTVAEKAVDVYKKGNKILIAGNGGSAADAQHLAGELVNKFYFDRPGLPCIALTTDTSVLTAIANDYGFESVFSRQLQANGVKGDMFIGISTSGNSPNIIKAMHECKKLGIISVGFTGNDGGKMKDICDYSIDIPSKETPRIQEAQIMVGHIVCSIIEQMMFGEKTHF